MDKPKASEASGEGPKAAYLEAYMAQQAAALQHQTKYRYEGPLPGGEDRKRGSAANGTAKMFTAVAAGGVGGYPSAIKVPQLQPGAESFKANLDATFTVPDDGLGFDDGVRVLRTLGSWTPEYPGLSTRSATGMLFPDLPYAHPDMAINQRKMPPSVLPTTLPAPQPLGRSQPSLPPKKDPHAALQQPAPPAKVNGVTSTVHNSNKSFTCTICGKSLARKDKLVIHTRIHTGEKPYVCEVCDKAFARRDKLVIHMNKMKHRTPTNIAPLGKRATAEKPPSAKKEEPEEGHNGPKATMTLQTAAANWSCELCGQMMTTREEWMVHAKAHLEEKITGIGVISPSNFPNNQRAIGQYGGNAVHVPASGYPAVPQHPAPYPTFAIPERQYCPVCRQSFASKPEFMLHVRAHFDTAVKPQEEPGQQPPPPASNAPPLDNPGICS